MKVTVKTTVIGELGTLLKGFVKELEDLELRGDYPDYNITKIDQNTAKSSGD